MYARANMGHPSRTIGLGWEIEVFAHRCEFVPISVGQCRGISQMLFKRQNDRKQSVFEE
jgi:hypothetical protein